MAAAATLLDSPTKLVSRSDPPPRLAAFTGNSPPTKKRADLLAGKRPATVMKEAATQEWLEHQATVAVASGVSPPVHSSKTTPVDEEASRIELEEASPASSCGKDAEEDATCRTGSALQLYEHEEVVLLLMPSDLSALPAATEGTDTGAQAPAAGRGPPPPAPSITLTAPCDQLDGTIPQGLLDDYEQDDADDEEENPNRQSEGPGRPREGTAMANATLAAANRTLRGGACSMASAISRRLFWVPLTQNENLLVVPELQLNIDDEDWDHIEQTTAGQQDALYASEPHELDAAVVFSNSSMCNNNSAIGTEHFPSLSPVGKIGASGLLSPRSAVSTPRSFQSSALLEERDHTELLLGTPYSGFKGTEEIDIIDDPEALPDAVARRNTCNLLASSTPPAQPPQRQLFPHSNGTSSPPQPATEERRRQLRSSPLRAPASLPRARTPSPSPPRSPSPAEGLLHPSQQQRQVGGVVLGATAVEGCVGGGGAPLQCLAPVASPPPTPLHAPPLPSAPPVVSLTLIGELQQQDDRERACSRSTARSASGATGGFERCGSFGLGNGNRGVFTTKDKDMPLMSRSSSATSMAWSRSNTSSPAPIADYVPAIGEAAKVSNGDCGTGTGKQSAANLESFFASSPPPEPEPLLNVAPLSQPLTSTSEEEMQKDEDDEQGAADRDDDSSYQSNATDTGATTDETSTDDDTSSCSSTTATDDSQPTSVGSAVSSCASLEKDSSREEANKKEGQRPVSPGEYLATPQPRRGQPVPHPVVLGAAVGKESDRNSSQRTADSVDRDIEAAPNTPRQDEALSLAREGLSGWSAGQKRWLQDMVAVTPSRGSTATPPQSPEGKGSDVSPAVRNPLLAISTPPQQKGRGMPGMVVSPQQSSTPRPPKDGVSSLFKRWLGSGEETDGIDDDQQQSFASPSAAGSSRNPLCYGSSAGSAQRQHIDPAGTCTGTFFPRRNSEEENTTPSPSLAPKSVRCASKPLAQRYDSACTGSTGRKSGGYAAPPLGSPSMLKGKKDSVSGGGGSPIFTPNGRGVQVEDVSGSGTRYVTAYCSPGPKRPSL